MELDAASFVGSFHIVLKNMLRMGDITLYLWFFRSISYTMGSKQVEIFTVPTSDAEMSIQRNGEGSCI